MFNQDTIEEYYNQKHHDLSDTTREAKSWMVHDEYFQLMNIVATSRSDAMYFEIIPTMYKTKPD